MYNKGKNCKIKPYKLTKEEIVIARGAKNRPTKEMIVQIASKLYLEKGFEDTSNKEICEILRISPGNLTFHYPQREHVLTEFVKELCDFQWRMIDVLEHDDKSPLLALCFEFAANAAIAEESNAMRDIYIATYTHPMPLAVIRENDTRKNQQIFSEFNPDWTDEQFRVMEALM